MTTRMSPEPKEYTMSHDDKLAEMPVARQPHSASCAKCGRGVRKPTHRCSCGWEGRPRARAGVEPMCAACGLTADRIS
jgi:hypothetical protein